MGCVFCCSGGLVVRPGSRGFNMRVLGCGRLLVVDWTSVWIVPPVEGDRPVDGAREEDIVQPLFVVLAG